MQNPKIKCKFKPLCFNPFPIIVLNERTKNIITIDESHRSAGSLSIR